MKYVLGGSSFPMVDQSLADVPAMKSRAMYEGLEAQANTSTQKRLINRRRFLPSGGKDRLTRLRSQVSSMWLLNGGFQVRHLRVFCGEADATEAMTLSMCFG